MKKHVFAAALALLATAAFAQPGATPPVSVPASPPPGMMAPPQMSPADELKMAKAQMVRFDTNHDGKVDLVEFLKPATDTFNQIDAGKTGFITPEMMVAYMHKVNDARKAAFEAAMIKNAAAAGRTAVAPGSNSGKSAAPAVVTLPAPAK